MTNSQHLKIPQNTIIQREKETKTENDSHLNFNIDLLKKNTKTNISCKC